MARAKVSFALDRAAVGQLFTTGGTVYVGVGRFANRVLARAAADAPRRTGALARSLRKVARVTPLGVSFAVGSELGYAAAVHEGTEAHTITAPAGGVLVFTTGGRKVFARRVAHPGATANPFIRRALETELARGV